MSTQDKVRAFHEAFNLDIARRPRFPSVALAALRRRLNEEECIEAEEEFFKIEDEDPTASLSNLAKELGDMLYVVYGAGVALGIDLDEVVAEIHRSNMTKLDANGRPIFRDDGKVLKGPNYEEANIEAVLGRQYAREAA